jgi:CHAD domain-containing protein
VKARKVKHLDPAGSFESNAARIVAVRSQEVLDLGNHAQDPSDVKALHDLRIAAKRLRYLLELTGVGGTDSPVKQLKRLQDLLGDIHDCDVQLPPLRALARETGEPEALGLRTLAIHFATRRAELFERFYQGWPDLERTFMALSHAADGGQVEVPS